MQTLLIENRMDKDGRIAGGTVSAVGLQINWQDGTRREPDGSVNQPNGCCIVEVLAAVQQRLAWTQSVDAGSHGCGEYEEALQLVTQAIKVLRAPEAPEQPARPEALTENEPPPEHFGEDPDQGQDATKAAPAAGEPDSPGEPGPFQLWVDIEEPFKIRGGEGTSPESTT